MSSSIRVTPLVHRVARKSGKRRIRPWPLNEQETMHFRPMSEAEFIDAVMTGMPIAPSYYPTMKRVNKVGPALLDDLAEGRPADRC